MSFLNMTNLFMPKNSLPRPKFPPPKNIYLLILMSE